MTIWGIISLLLHWLGFIQWGASMWEKHEAAVKTKAVKNAITDIDRMSDADVDKRMRSNWLRDDKP